MSREELRGLKGKTDKNIHTEHINYLVSYFHTKVIEKAKTSTESSIQLQGYGDFFDPHCDSKLLKFTENDKLDLLTGLRTLFPGCLVEYQILVQGNDGNMYDFSKIDKAMLSYINNQYTREYLVIDWS